MSGINEVREAAVNPSKGGGVLGILIGLLVGLTGILIGLLLFFAPPEMAMSFFDRGDEASFQDLHCPALVGDSAFGDGSVRPADPLAGEGELLPAVNRSGLEGGAQDCLNMFNTGMGGGAQLMSFFACQNNLRTSVGMSSMDFSGMCSSVASTGSLCLQPCDPNVANACGDSGLTCTKENGGYFCDGPACQPQPGGAKCAEKCDPANANACMPGLECKPAGSSFTCQGPNCSAPTEQATQPPASTQPANPQDQPTPVCTPNPNDNVCSACENTDLDSNACVCNMDGVCGPQEGFNCGDCQPDSGGDDRGGKRNGGNNGGGNQCTCNNGVDSCTGKKC